MTKVIQVYRYVNILSLDVVAGSLICALFFARIFFVDITPYGLIALALTVWIIYTTDHLRDAKKIGRQASTARHRFHQRHFNILVVMLMVSVILDAIAILFIRRQVLEWGLVLAAAVSVYLLTHRFLKFLKEVFIAVMYTCGVLLPSLPITSVEISLAHYLLILQFALLALINLFMFSWFDRELDQQDKQHSYVTLMGDRETRISIWVLAIVDLSLTIVPFFFATLQVPSLILAAMGVILLVIFIFRASFATNDYYRLLGDAVFIIPVFYLL